MDPSQVLRAQHRQAVPGLACGGGAGLPGDGYLTTISIIVPVYDPPVAFLRQCLESVVGQRARNWQLVVANDGSTNPTSRTSSGSSPRSTRATTASSSWRRRMASSALNAALDRATGEYVGMLDHDDLLDPRCIDEFSRALEEHHFRTAVYSDEDKVNPRGEHFELYCKPDFSPELLLTQMYLCHFTIFRREQVVACGGLRSDMDGAQDFDLALRLLPGSNASSTCRGPITTGVPGPSRRRSRSTRSHGRSRLPPGCNWTTSMRPSAAAP